MTAVSELAASETIQPVSSRNAWPWLRAVVDLIVPPRCVLCAVDLPPQRQVMLCGHCEIAITAKADEPRCPRCAAVLTTGDRLQPRTKCYFCRERTISYQAAMVMAGYDGLLRDALLQMKSTRGDSVARAVGTLWAERLDPLVHRWWADCIVPVPLHWRRRWARGSNSAEILASALARHLKLPVLRSSVARRRATAPQFGLLPEQRLRNVRHAFHVRRPADIAGKRVILVDDILTTGATCGELTRELRHRGAAWIGVVAVAKAADAQDDPATLNFPV